MGSHLFCELRCRLDKNVSSGIGVSVFVQTLCTCKRRERAQQVRLVRRLVPKRAGLATGGGFGGGGHLRVAQNL